MSSKVTSFTDIDADVAAEIPAQPSAAAPVAEQPAPTQALVPAQPAALASYEEDFDCANDGFANDLDAKNLNIPRLQLAHGVGGLAQKGYVPGSIVFAEQVALAEPKRGEIKIPASEGVLIYPLKGLGRGLDYQEVLPKAEMDAGKKPRAFKTEDEAKAAGLFMGKERQALQAANPGAHIGQYTFRLTLLVLVQLPTGVDSPLFPFEFDGKKYALAQLTLAKGSYWKAGKELYNHVNTARMLNRSRPGEYPMWYMGWRMFCNNDPIPGKADRAWTFYTQPAAAASAEFKAWAAQFAG